MRINKLWWVMLYAWLFIIPTSQADKLLIEGINSEPPNVLEGIPRPKNGMKMQRVKEIFGPPNQALKPVGRPPIIRWIYDDFTIYFENNIVINTVVNKKNKTQQ